MPPPKTLHLTNAYHPDSGGIRAVYHTLLDAAERLQRHIRLVVPGPEHRVEDVNPYARIYFVRSPRAWTVDRRYRLVMPWRYLLPLMPGVRAILQAEQPDIVEVCDKHSLPYVAGLLRVGWIPRVPRPTLVGTSAERFDDNVETFVSGAGPALAFARWFMRNVYTPMFDFHIANSEYTAQELRAALPPHRQGVVHVVPPGINAEWFEPLDGSDTRAALIREMGGNLSTRLLVYAGRLSPEKNVQLLIDTLDCLAAREVSHGCNYRLVVAGGGPSSTLLETAAARRPGRVRMLGSLQSRAAVRRVLAAADVFVHPNPREPFGLAPLEAMAAGRPVVAPDTGGVLTYADRQTAWLAPAEPTAFATAIGDVMASPAATNARVTAARLRATAFHETGVSSRFFELLDRLHGARLDRQAAAPDGIPSAIAEDAAASR